MFLGWDGKGTEGVRKGVGTRKHATKLIIGFVILKPYFRIQMGEYRGCQKSPF